MKAMRFCVTLFFSVFLAVLVSGCVNPPKDLSIRENREYVYVNHMLVCCDGFKNPYIKGSESYRNYEKSLPLFEGLIYTEQDLFTRNVNTLNEITVYDSRNGKGRVYLWHSMEKAFVFEKTVPPQFWAARTADHPYYMDAPRAPFVQRCSKGYRTCIVWLKYGDLEGKIPTKAEICRIYDLDCEHPVYGPKDF